MTDAAWPMHISTTTFVAHPDDLDQARHRYLERLNQIPAEHARISHLADYPWRESSTYLLWNLRCGAVFESQRGEIRDPATLELFSLHCVLSINPEHEEAVHEKLFFGDHTAFDPFPGMLVSHPLVPFHPGEKWEAPPAEEHIDAPKAALTPKEPAVPATQWLLTLYLLAAEGEGQQLAAEYARLIEVVRTQSPGITLLSSSAAPLQFAAEDPDAAAAVAGPLWLKACRQLADNTATPGVYPLAQWPHRARLVVTCASDPLDHLPDPKLTGSWEAEPLV
ncbi:hypothetical protein [Corynebacterium sp. A21]|uniref:hypothetical protein n=1 Tax=Corynebacterium sp. A21 TaxID=3457318 RepID=UPI003FD3DD11